MKHRTIGILAHVDAGKTTCIESMLYNAGQLRTLGRVDHQDAFLDYDSQERNRGITIYSKEAHIQVGDTQIHIIDTPGHIDFSSEMERTLSILDLAIVLINGQDGVQSHTKTIWDCLTQYHVPTLVFVNKMDITHTSKEALMHDLETNLSSNIINFQDTQRDEKLALTNEDILNTYIETNTITDTQIQELVYTRQAFPCYFGSALKNTGIDELMNAIVTYSLDTTYPQEFGAKVYKVSSDTQGNTLTHVKITGGTLLPKQVLKDEKVDQIRLYNGQKFEPLPQAEAGMICCLKGLKTSYVGEGFGFEQDHTQPLLNPYLNYQVQLPYGIDPLEMKKHFDALAQEDPNLHIEFDEATQTTSIQLMGDIQMEILQNRILEQTGIQVGFTSGHVIYKETITQSALGVGHFEPLRHYAEVHVRIDPLKTGSGIEYASEVSSDDLQTHWQRLILTHMEEKMHRGILLGAPLTDVKITLVAGKGHQKHTQGGDFRQATYRAIRHALTQTSSIVLEPYYRFELRVPSESLSRALYDLEQKQASVQIEDASEGWMRIYGSGPVRTLMNYQAQVVAFTKGQGQFSCQLDGYHPCRDQEKIIEERGYDFEKDLRNPTGSVFCAHGSGFYVPYDEVMDYMHIQPKEEKTQSTYRASKYTISSEEAKRVFAMVNGRNQSEAKKPKPTKKAEIKTDAVTIHERKPTCIVVDGYNQLYSWSAFKEIVKKDFGVARERLIDALSNYQGYRNVKMIVVFDAYRVKDISSRNEHRGHMDIVYTKYGQTADQYIEKLVHTYKNSYELIVASSDGLIQNAILANGAKRMSSIELEGRVMKTNANAFQQWK